MPSTPDHKVEMHQLARSRVAAGLPVWDRKIRLGDVFHNRAMTFGQRRDAIVDRIRTSGWMEGRDEDDELSDLLGELAASRTPDEFDVPWDEIYDLANVDRVWIETVS